MIYFKSVLVGLGTALLGCVVTPIVMIVWVSWRASKAAPSGPGEQVTVSFSPLGFINHFWWFFPFILALFCLGFLLSVYLRRR